MRMLLVNTPIHHDDHEVVNRLPPLGLLYVAAYARRRLPDATFAVVDAPSNGWGVERCSRAIADHAPDVLGLNVFTPTVQNVAELIKDAKASDRPPLTVVGGPHASLAPDETLARTDPDHVIVGEGEVAFAALVTQLSGCHTGRASSPLRIIRPEHRLTEVPHPAIDELPYPALDLLDLGRYTHDGTRTGFVMTARGCPFDCSYCCSPTLCGRRYMPRSVDSVIGEVRHQIESHTAGEIHFLDDTLTVSTHRVSELSRRLAEIGASWRGLSRSDIPADLVRRMAAAGCRRLSFGVESGAPEILTRIKKRLDLRALHHTLDTCAQLGVKTKAFFMAGFPFERPEHLLATLNLAISLKRQYGTESAFNIVKIYPGTELASQYPELCDATIADRPAMPRSPIQERFAKYCDLPARSVNPYFSTDELLRILALAYGAIQAETPLTLAEVKSIRTLAAADTIKATATDQEIGRFVSAYYS